MIPCPSAPSQASTSVGVALGGGTARAYSHIGALKVLEAQGLYPHQLAGTSAGAVMAALYSLLGSASSLETMALRQNVLELWRLAFDIGWHKWALIAGRRLEGWFERLFDGRELKDLPLPVTIACTDVVSGELCLFQEGPVAPLLVASCALPGLLAPKHWQGRLLVDGGLSATVPFAGIANTRLQLGLHSGIHAERSWLIRLLRRWYKLKPVQTALQPMDTRDTTSGHHLRLGLSRLMGSYRQMITAPEGAHLIHLHPNIAWWDFHKAQRAIAAGEQAMESALKIIVRDNAVLLWSQ
jgi:predicted acylesterase/phospholipase RssA